MRTSTTRDRTTIDGRDLRRLGGFALMAALPVQVVGFALHPAAEELVHTQQSVYGTSHLVLFFSWVLVMLGLPSLYRAVAERAGRLGLVAFAGTMFAVAYHLYLTLYEATVIPLLAGLPNAAELVGDGRPLAHGAGALGPAAGLAMLAFPLFGVAVLRSRALPRAAGWLQVMAVPVFVLLMLAVGAATGGAVGPDATSWVGGMLPISSLYWLLFAGYAVGGRSLWRRGERVTILPDTAETALQPAP